MSFGKRCLFAVVSAIAFAACGKTTTQVVTTTTTAAKPAAISKSDSDAALAAAEAAVVANPMKEAYFGEQHVHTAYSLDAFIGGARLTPSDAYRFAKGAEVTVSGQKFSIGRPLDFAAVTDHAEYLGEMYTTLVEGAPGYDQEMVKELRGLQSIEEREKWFQKYVVGNNRAATPQHPPFFAGPQTTVSAWQVELGAARDHYEPGKFTTLAAFEWTGAPKGANLHRNVFFRDMNVPLMPMSSYEINREDGMWQWMDGLEKQGMKVLAIPHNSNASKGMMFSPNDAAGKPIDLAYAKLRNHFEPLIEMMQIKGNSEVHRNFWAADEFSDFENADSIQDYSERTFRKDDFVRYGVIKGLDYQQKLGANPFQYGFVGGTDSHNGTPSNVAEDNFMAGSHGAADDTVERRRTSEVGGWIKGKDLNPGSLTGVWAPKNTRAAIWDAMAARETFATSGPRIRVRMFAGADLPAKPADARTLVTDGYGKGVPMGGTLSALTKPPTFTVYAQKDGLGAHLDRIQIIKGWVDAKGEPQERIVDVVWSGERKKDASGKLPSVGNTVDLKTATYSNSIGAPVLMGSWTDDKFDPKQHALYYARVLEIPTPRWSTYDAVRSKLPLLKDVPATIQERAWTSPIWYAPR
jgi:hypothetical protein